MDDDTAAAVDDLQRLADDVVALEESTGASTSRRYPEPYDTTDLPLDLAAQQVAEAERQRLDLGDGPLLRLRQVLEDDVGIRVFAVTLAPKVAGLFALAEPAGACVAVNAAHPHERQRWTLAHEYAHFLTSRTEPEVTRLHPGRASRDERLADAFAAHFLMPATGVTRRFQNLRRSRGTFTTAELLQMAATYEVSAEAMAHRLEGLRLVGSGWWDWLKDQGLRVGRGPRGRRPASTGQGHPGHADPGPVPRRGRVPGRPALRGPALLAPAARPAGRPAVSSSL